MSPDYSITFYRAVGGTKPLPVKVPKVRFTFLTDERGHDEVLTESFGLDGQLAEAGRCSLTTFERDLMASAAPHPGGSPHG